MKPPEDIEAFEARLFDLLNKAKPGLIVISAVGVWIVCSRTGYVIGESLADAITKAEHRGLLE